MADSQPGAPLLHRPGAPLSRYVEYSGYWRSGADPILDRALPRGAATVIVDLSDDSRLGLYAADGATRLDVHRARRLLPAGWRLSLLRRAPASS